MRERLYMIGFTAALCFACAVLLTGASRLLAGFQDRNRELEKIQNVLKVFQIQYDKKASFEETKALYEQKVRSRTIDGMDLYELKGEGGVAGIAFPVHGSGFWGPIHGLLALEPDRRTIMGVSFYEHEETPGLGARISEAEFQDPFKGKRIVGSDGVPGIKITKEGERKGINEVDALTGATRTCEAVQKFLTENIKEFLKLDQKQTGAS